jgi:hypothetical protein
VGKLILFMPVHRTGELLIKALESLRSVPELVDEVVISLNSGVNNSTNRRKILTLFQGQDNLHIIETPKEMTSKEHLKFVLGSYPANAWKEQDQVLLFFDDDIFLPENLLKCLGLLTQSPGDMLLGGWLETQDKKNHLFVDAGFLGQKSPTAWVTEMGTTGYRYTNGSGMVIPVSALRAYGRASRFLRSGARFEYFVATHKSVRRLISSKETLVKIFRHAEQEGATLLSHESRWNEVVYQFWLLYQGRRPGVIHIGKGLYLLVANLVLYLWSEAAFQVSVLGKLANRP